MAAKIKANTEPFWMDLPEGSCERIAALKKHMAVIREKLSSFDSQGGRASVTDSALTPANVASLLPPEFSFVRTEGRHRLILRAQGHLSTPVKGHILLTFEKRLRREVDPGAEVFLDPKGDLNALRRKLRGVTAGWRQQA